MRSAGAERGQGAEGGSGGPTREGALSTLDPDDLEIAALGRQRDELLQTLAAQRQRELALRDAAQQLRGLMAATRMGILISENGFGREANDRFLEMYGYTSEELLGMKASELLDPASLDVVYRHIRDNDETPYEVISKRKDGSQFFSEVCGKVILYQGRPARVTLVDDITERKREEEALRAALVREETIRAQEALLAALSTPLLPISDDLVVLPLIGALTAERAERVVSALVEGVYRQRASMAILDITGVPAIDAHVAGALIRAARAARLLGALVVLTGLRPEVAGRLVALGTDLTGLVTFGSLQQGIAFALGRQKTPARLRER
jgi:rsbT co-antagonist protein RsbR